MYSEAWNKDTLLDTCLLVDGYSLAFRAFYALPQTLTNSSGQPTNALHGFSKMLATLIERYRPDYLAVALDFPAPTFRDELLATYKGQRPTTPEALKAQLEILRPLIASLGVKVVEQQGYEADDVVATLATLARDRAIKSFIVTGDRDSFQLVEDPLVAVLYNRRGVSEIDLMDESAVEKKTGVPPRLYPHLAALRGDPSDNLPGVPGIGEKTAAKLVQTYGSVQEVYRNLDALPEKQRQALSTCKDQVDLNLKMTMMVRDVPLSETMDDLRIAEWSPQMAEATFIGLDLRSAYTAFRKAFTQRPTNVDDDLFQETTARGAIVEIPTLLPVSIGQLEFDESVPTLDYSLGSGSRDVLEYLAVANGRNFAVLKADKEGFVEELRELIGKLKGRAVEGISLKSLLRALGMMGLGEVDVVMDCALAEYLIDPGSRSLDLDSISWRYLNISASQGSEESNLFQGVSEHSSEKLQRRLEVLAALAEPLRQRLTAGGLMELFESVEVPLSKVLARMEVRGVLVDVSVLRSLNFDLQRESAELLDRIRSLTRPDLNPNSPQQLAKVLFEDLKLPAGKKTKTGYSTDAKVLEKLRGVHPVVELILSYREVDKLRSTFAEGLLAEVRDDGRIHATFSQTVARTGRISSESPNLHNIPIRSERGRLFRDVFVAPEGSVLVVADYSQIELRVIAHLSHDENLIAALTSDHDVHSETASMVFQVPIDAVTPEQRSKAKMVAYGLAYGMEAYGLAQRLNISTLEAEDILQSFFSAFPKVKSYTERSVAEARSLGYTKTLLGRRRYFPDLNSANRSLRLAAERQAMNAGIQGLAADIFKVALLRIEERLSDKEAQLVLQIHDEVVVESKESIAAEVAEIVEDAMSNAMKLVVPLVVNVGIGKRWSDAK